MRHYFTSYKKPTHLNFHAGSAPHWNKYSHIIDEWSYSVLITKRHSKRSIFFKFSNFQSFRFFFIFRRWVIWSNIQLWICFLQIWSIISASDKLSVEVFNGTCYDISVRKSLNEKRRIMTEKMCRRNTAEVHPFN